MSTEKALEPFQSIGLGQARRRSSLLTELERRLRKLVSHPTLLITYPENVSYKFGEGEHDVEMVFRNRKAIDAGASFDELRIAEAHLEGDIEIEGSVFHLLLLRRMLDDRRLLIRLKSLTYRVLLDTPMFRKKWIGFHYDEDPRLFLCFLDTKHRCYSHGFFESEDEPLERAMERKLQFAVTATGLKPGMRVLDIGGGWGSFMQFAGGRGIEVTSLTISDGQRDYLEKLIANENLPCRVLLQDFYEYEVPETDRYDAIVNLGVSEHLSNYERLVSQYRRLLRPGGRIYFDSCASRQKFDVGSYITKHIFPGCTSYLCLDRFFAEVAKTDLEIELVANDRRNYMLTTMKWGENLERNREQVLSAVGEQTYRRFRLLIWACAAGFHLDEISAYHAVLKG